MLRSLLAALVAFTLSAPLTSPLAAQTLERITSTGQLKLGFRTDAIPLSYQDDQGNPAGYAPIICSQIAQGISNALGLDNLSVTFVPVSADNRFEMVQNGEIDLLCGAATITMRRRDMVDFSVPIYVDGTAVMQPKDASGDLTLLGGKNVGVRKDTTTEEALRNTVQVSGLAMNIVTFDDHRAGMQAMVDGTIEAYFADQSILMYLLGTSTEFDKFRVSPDIMTVEKQGLALARGDADFRQLVDSLLSELFETGAMREIFKAALPGAQIGRGMESVFITSPTQP